MKPTSTSDKKYVIYSRKSKFTGKGESIENQIELCRGYIAAHFGEEFASSALVYEDEGFSGGNLERPQFKKMMADSRKTDFAAIVVYRLDRISRNIGDFAKLIEDLGERGIDFISIREQFDTSSPMGRAMMYIASVFSQLERETIAERIRDNMSELAKTGRWLGGITPTGYESESVATVTLDGKTRKACKLKIIPREAELVRLIFAKFAETGSLTKTDEFLLIGRYKTRQGKSFTRFAIKNILTNPVYMIADGEAYNYLRENGVELFAAAEDFDGIHGIMAYNRTLQKAGKSNQLRPINEWIVSVGKHEGIISGEDWIKAQKILGINKSKSYRKPRSNVALLSGILRCGSCGDYMRPKLTDRVNADGEQVYTYLCNTKERSRGGVCNISNPSGNMLDKNVVKVLKDFGKNGDELAEMILQSKKKITKSAEGLDGEISRIKEQIEDNEKQIRALVSSIVKAEGTAAESYITDEINRLHENGESLKTRLSELVEMTEQHQLSDIEFDLIVQTLSGIGSGIDSFSVEQKRVAIRTVIKKIVWDGKKAHIYLFGSDGEVEFPEEQEVLSEPLGENSKRNPHALSGDEENRR